MKYLKPIHEKFEFGYEREIIEDFIEDMSEFEFHINLAIRENTKYSVPYRNFDEFIKNKKSNGKLSINIDGSRYTPPSDNLTPSKIKNLSSEEYNYIKGLIEDFKDKIEDMSNMKIIEIGMHTGLHYHYHHKIKKDNEEFKNLRFAIVLLSK